MSTEISLVVVSIREAPIPLKRFVPYVVDELTGLGFSTLNHTLENHNGVTGLVARDDDDSVPGYRRYYVPNPEVLADHIEKHGAGVEWNGLNGDAEVVEILRKYSNCTFWFHVNF